MDDFETLTKQMRACAICADLPLGPRPLFKLDVRARVLIAGQAPGRITHQKGIPFDDPSGNRLRDWLGVTRDVFYNDPRIAILPMGLCFRRWGYVFQGMVNRGIYHRAWNVRLRGEIGRWR